MTLKRFLSAPGRSSARFSLTIAAVLLAVAVPVVSAQEPAAAPRQQQQPPPPPPTAGAKLEILPEGSSASYSVNEQLAGIGFPNDAIGTTSLAGTFVIAADGSIPAGSSKLTADLSKLKSDQDQRDGYVKNRTLETDKFPLAEFVPTKISGIPTMIPFQGQTGLQITGNLTIHGVTKEVTLQGYATFNRDGTIAGRAKTDFTFATFGLTKPSLARLMSVGDKISLDLVFRFKRS